ncbi:hypothetical protein [Campylobacter majalis]|uniref:hypothetical protein n=1 Tax=Campylobacter majalis TaxID=2790656 RepID=UPI003D69C85D
MKQIKILLFSVTMALIFAGCDEKIEKQPEIIPSDIPIAQSENNTTIDENFPPEPVIEGEQ